MPLTRNQRSERLDSAIKEHMAIRAVALGAPPNQEPIPMVDLSDSEDEGTPHAVSKSLSADLTPSGNGRNSDQISDRRVGSETQEEDMDAGVTSFSRYQSVTEISQAHRLDMMDIEETYPELARPSQKPVSTRFLTTKAARRYALFQNREFIDSKFLPLHEPSLKEVEEILAASDLICSVLEIPKYAPEVVREFYANLPDAEIKGNYNMVYVRGHLFDVGPDVINNMLLLDSAKHVIAAPAFQQSVPLAEAVHLVTGGALRRWKDMEVKHFTSSMKVLHQLCCYNWLPTTASSEICQKKIQLMYLVATATPFNLGKLIFDQIISVANTTRKISDKLPFPNLIYQMLQYHREVPLHSSEVMSGLPMPLSLNNQDARDEEISLNDAEQTSGVRATTGVHMEYEAGDELDREHTSSDFGGMARLAADVKRLDRLSKEMDLLSKDIQRKFVAGVYGQLPEGVYNARRT